MLHLNQRQGVGVDQIRTGQKVGVKCIHVCVEPVVVLKVAVLILCERAGHVLCKVAQVLGGIVHLQFRQGTKTGSTSTSASRTIGFKLKVPFGELDVLVIVPDNDLLDVGISDKIADEHLEGVDTFPAKENGRCWQEMFVLGQEKPLFGKVIEAVGGFARVEDLLDEKLSF